MGEFLHIPGDWLSQTKNIPGRTTLYSPGAILGSGITLNRPRTSEYPKAANFLQKARMRKLINGKNAARFPLWNEEKG